MSVWRDLTVLFLLIVFVGGAQAASEELVTQATERTKLKGCGKQTLDVEAALQLVEPSGWSLELAGTAYEGTYGVKGKKERKLLLEMDGGSIGALAAYTSVRATTLCDTPTTAGEVAVKAFRVARRKNGVAKMKLVVGFVSDASGKKGRLRVTGRGTLAPVSTTTSTTPTTTMPPTTLPSTTTTTTNVTTTTLLGTTSSTVAVTSTSTTSTTIAPSECAGSMNGTPCSDDGMGCTGDICVDGLCVHPIANPGTVCRVAAYPCDEAEVCDGVSGDCPVANDPLCPDGETCTADEQCVSGACYQGVCVLGDARIFEPCDSDPDCFAGVFAEFVCDGGECRADFDTFCVEPGQCATDLDCDLEGSGRCKRAIGVACEADPDCADDAACSPASGTCLLDVDVACVTNDQCATGFCSCALLAANSCPGQSCSPVQCVSPGLCKLPLGADCTTNFFGCPETFQVDALGAGFRTIAFGRCAGGICVPGKLVLGTVCEVDPPGGLLCNEATTGGLAGAPCTSGADCPGGACQLTPPQRHDSPNDALCASGSCFKGAGGENGPCTPDDEPCGGPVNPPDYVCCRGDNGVCTKDFDCCGVFLDRARGCGSNGRCRPLAGGGEPCTTTDDCLRRGELECIRTIPCQAEPCGVCEKPFVPLVLDAGAECDPTVDSGNGFCGPGLVCLNCEPEGRGHRCADASAPCCRSGAPDDFWCGSSVVSEDITWTNSCCDYGCVHPLDDQHCGGCDQDCTDLSDEACALEGSGRCELTNGFYFPISPLFICRADPDPALCVDPDPTDGTTVQCVSTLAANGDLGTLCQEVIPYVSTPCVDCIPWEGACFDSGPAGRQCTSDSQCYDCDNACSCGVPVNAVQGLLDISYSCQCN